jgi:hypothetical protein
MGRRQKRQALMAAFALALLMGTAVYFRIWARQSSDPYFTADDREELRFAPQFLSAFVLLHPPTIYNLLYLIELSTDFFFFGKEPNHACSYF